jgi:hypothetical protein
MESLAEKMDTREKIIATEDIPDSDWIAVVGLFDPLTVNQAQRIADVRTREPQRPLLAVVLPGENTLLSAEARAALVAGLRNVDAVVIANADQIVSRGLPLEHDPAAEQRRSTEFVEFVLARQQAKEVTAKSGQ